VNRHDFIQQLQLPLDNGRDVHQNRLLQHRDRRASLVLPLQDVEIPPLYQITGDSICKFQLNINITQVIL
jgi:hypothetical protein